MPDACCCSNANHFLYQFEKSFYVLHVRQVADDKVKNSQQTFIRRSLCFWELGGNADFSTQIKNERTVCMPWYREESINCIKYLNRVALALSTMAEFIGATYDNYESARTIINLERKRLDPRNDAVQFNLSYLVSIYRAPTNWKALEPLLAEIRNILNFYKTSQKQTWRECLSWLDPDLFNLVFQNTYKAFDTAQKRSPAEKQLVINSLNHLFCIWSTLAELFMEETYPKASDKKFHEIVADPLIMNKLTRKALTYFKNDELYRLLTSEKNNYLNVVFLLCRSKNPDLVDIGEIIRKNAQENIGKGDAEVSEFFKVMMK